MSLWVEKWYPYLGGLIVFICYQLFIRPIFVLSSFCNLFSAVVSVSGIAIGFLATAKSILFSIQNRRVIKQLKDQNLYNLLIKYIMSAIRICFMLALISAAGLLIDEKNPPSWLPSAFSFWVFLSTVTTLSCYRVIQLFSKILTSKDND